jgi:hypothetical protein
MATIKNWGHHPDKILAELCRCLTERDLLKVKLQAAPFGEAIVNEKERSDGEAGYYRKRSGLFCFYGEASTPPMIPG